MRMLFALILICGSQVAFSQGTWTWISGDSLADQNGVFGTQGIPSPNNTPPALYEAAEWTDAQGNFWLFGGVNQNGQMYSDLWRIDQTLNQWIWVKGPGIPNKPAIHGTQGVSAPSNNPPAGFCSSSWVDLSGNLWLYGGMGFDSSSGSGNTNDLWRYNINTNEWTWMKGNGLFYSAPTYGSKGVPGVSNSPGGRIETAANWVDANGDLWLFGGCITPSNTQNLNDLWRYTISTNQWTWISGDSVPNKYGVYGQLGVASASNIPGSRWVYSAWADQNHNLWLWGGTGYAAFPNNGKLNDLWMFNTISNEWTWIGGDSVPGQNGPCGNLCDSAGSPYPSARFESRSRIVDPCGYFWLVAGENTAQFNDIWRYDPLANTWTRVGGDCPYSGTPSYGIKGISSASNIPGGRNGCAIWMKYSALWIWGGYGQASNVNGSLNDLWQFTMDSSCYYCPLGVGEIHSDNNISFSPNPFSESTTLNLPGNYKLSTGTCLFLFDLLGNKIKSIPIQRSSTKIDRNNLSSGIYIYRLLAGSEILFSGKLIIE